MRRNKVISAQRENMSDVLESSEKSEGMGFVEDRPLERKTRIVSSDVSSVKESRIWNKLIRNKSEDEVVNLIKSQLEKKNLLGSGTYGNVYKVKIDNTEWAVKSLKDGYNHNLHEFQILFGFDHPCIMFAVAIVFYNDSKIAIVMPCATTTLNLENYRTEENTYKPYEYTYKQRIEIAYKVLSAVYFLHSRKYLHLDIRDMNVFIFKSKEGKIDVKLGDFSLTLFGQNGTPPKMKYTIDAIYGPEAKKKIGTFTDIYMLGSFFYILFFSYFPVKPDQKKYFDGTIFDWIKFLDTEEIKFIEECEDQEEKKIKKRVVRLLKKMLDPNESERIKLCDIFNNKLFSEIDYYFEGKAIQLTPITLSEKQKKQVIECYKVSMSTYKNHLSNVRSATICSAIRMMVRLIEMDFKFNEDSSYVLEEDLLTFCICIIESDKRNWKTFMSQFKSEASDLNPNVLFICYLLQGIIDDFYGRSNNKSCGQLVNNFPNNIDLFIQNSKN